MTSLASNLYRDLVCATAAALITLVLSLSFLESTADAPFDVASVAPVASAPSA